MSYQDIYLKMHIICSRHFQTDDMVRDFSRVTLKWNAVPSLNLPEQGKYYAYVLGNVAH